MRSGAMRHRITVLALPATQDAAGQPVTALPTPLFKTWAEIRKATSKEIYALGAGFTAQVTHAIRIRYPKTVPAAGMQVTFRGRTFRIQTSVDPDELERELDLMVLETGK